MTPVQLFYWNPAIDVPIIARMGLRFIQETRTGALMGGEPTLERLERSIELLAAAAQGTVIKAVRTDTHDVVGFAALLLVENPFTGGRYVDETGIWVEPEARGNTRAGALLVEASENWARQVGAAVLKMIAPPRSGFGRWLRRRGYELAEEVLITRL